MVAHEVTCWTCAWDELACAYVRHQMLGRALAKAVEALYPITYRIGCM